jgi:type IX secretion system PorP/SprF family membrane protein
VNVEALANSVYLFGGYHIPLNDDWKVTPTILAKTTAFKAYSFDAGAWLTYQEKFWGGLSYRNEESVNAFIGAYIPQKRGSKKMFRIGYSFDYIVNGKIAKQPTSHEILLAYTIPVPPIKLPSIIRTPRFRH